MKTHTIKTPTAELLIVELLENTKLWEFLDGKFWADDKQLFINGFTPFHTLLGKPDEISEEDAVQLIPMYFEHDKTAVEYLVEMIESEIYWDVNPYKDWLSHGEAHDDDLDHMWHEAQEKTFDRNRSLIFKKNK